MRRWRLLAVFFFVLGLANLARTALVPSVSAALAGWSLSIPLSLLAWIYGAFGSAFTVLAVFLFRKRGLRWALPLAGLYQAVIWGLHLAYRSDYAQSLWVRDLLLTVLFLAVVWWLSRRPHSEDAVS
jgi:hypothetical protein